jgi:hypothetical protein
MEKLPNVDKKEIDSIKKSKRESLCNFIKDKLLFLEKYATSADKNKKTYVMIPYDHPFYKFPYNLEDRIKNYLGQIKSIVSRDIDIKTIKSKNGVFLDQKNLPSYKIEFKDNKYTAANKKELEEFGCKLEKNIWSIIID